MCQCCVPASLLRMRVQWHTQSGLTVTSRWTTSTHSLVRMKGLSGTGQSGRESELGKEGGKEGGRKPCLALAEACGLGSTHRLVPPSSRFLHRCPSLSSSSSILHNTHAVYEKGAEVIRLYHTLLGAEGFRKGMDLYFQRHDGQVCVCAFVCVCVEEREREREREAEHNRRAGGLRCRASCSFPQRSGKSRSKGERASACNSHTNR
jgi:hypothetical protein